MNFEKFKIILEHYWLECDYCRYKDSDCSEGCGFWFSDSALKEIYLELFQEQNETKDETIINEELV